MKQRRFLATLLTLTLLLTACRTAAKDQPKQSTQPTKAEQTGSSTEPTAEATETKLIASVILSYSNGYSARTGFTYLSPTKIAIGEKKGGGIMKGDPIANPDGFQMTVADIPEDVFEELCVQLWELRFDQLPNKITQPDDYYVTDASDMYFCVRFEDGTEFTSSGYAADFYHDGFDAVWHWMYSNATALMDEYGSPEKVN